LSINFCPFLECLEGLPATLNIARCSDLDTQRKCESGSPPASIISCVVAQKFPSILWALDEAFKLLQPDRRVQSVCTDTLFTSQPGSGTASRSPSQVMPFPVPVASKEFHHNLR